jgi:hypothetical protein
MKLSVVEVQHQLGSCLGLDTVDDAFLAKRPVYAGTYVRKEERTKTPVRKKDRTN